jgi:hypothetical protein
MENQLRNQIIDDLLLKNPEHVYDNNLIFNMNLQTKSSVRSYIRDRFFNGLSNDDLGRKCATLTRRTNRIWDRIHTGVYAVRRSGGKGVWRVQLGYSEILGHIWARNRLEADRDAKMFFGYLSSNPDRLRVIFIEFGSHEKLPTHNRDLNIRLTERIKWLKRDYDEALKKYEFTTAIQTALELVEQHTIAVFSDE